MGQLGLLDNRTICSLLDKFKERGQNGYLGKLWWPYVRMAKSVSFGADELVDA